MTNVITPKKSVAVNPLKQSQPLGAALAFLGLKGMMPLFHGSQGCTAFAKVFLVRHFRESIPLSTTAMTEVSTILGGEENIEQAILALVDKAKPELIGLLTTGLTETRGDDMGRILKSFRTNHPELVDLPIIFASTPDYKGSLQSGYATAVEAIVSADYGVNSVADSQQVTILAGSFLSPGDVEEIKEIVTAFGLQPLVLPDLSGSLDGHLEDDYQTVTSGGTSLTQLQSLSNSLYTLAIGESMSPAAAILSERFNTDYQVFPRLAGLEAVDQFLWKLSQLSGLAVPPKYLRQRRQLQDAILDSHFYFGRKRIAIALEPDLLYQTSWLLQSMGAEITAAVTTTKSTILEDLPLETVVIGDLEDMENLLVDNPVDLLITNSQGKTLSEKLQCPLYRLGYPIFDRLGNNQRCLVGYRGTMQFLFDVGNLFLELEVNH
ncbi:MAG: nitrogenase iron-molybdenum cofactor biosynthesis protein NifN [Gloeocapsa sp. DLM2.Bin57]|nr:MAG: nitrogenase iron-molybdenum cofactor biosynthesis protein NifN [Gloeocapsa sp. DLM2.Bin57]